MRQFSTKWGTMGAHAKYLGSVPVSDVNLNLERRDDLSVRCSTFTPTIRSLSPGRHPEVYVSRSAVRPMQTGTHTGGPKLAIIRTQTLRSSTKGMGTMPLGQCVSVQLMHQGSTTESIPAAGRRQDW